MDSLVSATNEIEPVILTTAIGRAWHSDVRTVENGLRRQGIAIIELSPRKRAVRAKDYALLLKGRTR